MVGEHFDKIWIYIDHLTKINKAENKLTKGISKDLVYDALERAGLKVFDQFENENLFSYLNGDFAANGNFQYQAPISQSMVSASNAGSIPKGDITKEVWKRLSRVRKLPQNQSTGTYVKRAWARQCPKHEE